METCLLNYFILNKELKSSCDFNPFLFKEGPAVYEVVRIIEQKPLFWKTTWNAFSIRWNFPGCLPDCRKNKSKAA